MGVTRGLKKEEYEGPIVITGEKILNLELVVNNESAQKEPVELFLDENETSNTSKLRETVVYCINY